MRSPYFVKSDEDLQTALNAMEQAKESGKAKSVGVSNYLGPPPGGHASHSNLSSPVISQLEYQAYLQHADHYTS